MPTPIIMNKEIFLEPNWVVKNLKYMPLLGMVVLPIVLWFTLPNNEGWTYVGGAQQAIVVVLVLEIIVYLFLDRLSKMQTHYFIHEGTVTYSYGQQYKMKELLKFPLKGLELNKEVFTDTEGKSTSYWLSNKDDLFLKIDGSHKENLVDFFGMESEGQEDASKKMWTIPPVNNEIENSTS